MQPTKLDLDDSRKAQPRRAGLTRNYRHSLLQSINPPRKEERLEMPTEAGSKNRENNAGTSGDVNDKLRKREHKGSNKENEPGLPASSTMKNTDPIEIEDEGISRLPDDSDDGARYIVDSSDEDSPSKISADMTKTSFGSKNQKSSQVTTASPVLDGKSTSTKPSESNSTKGVKRKKGENDFSHNKDVDIFGNMQSSSKKRKSYIQTHKEHKPPKPGANNFTGKRAGPKKATKYGRKASPVKVFKNYGSSSPSLASDDGKRKLQDYTIDSPTKIQSPARGGLVVPDFSDDDFSDLDLSSKSKPSNSTLPSRKSKKLQLYDDAILDGAEELAKKVNPDALFGITNLGREDSSDLDDHTGPRCPMCNEAVAAEDLEAFGEMNTRKQEKFCLSHQRKSARSNWKVKGYPDIDWTTLDSRIANHHAFIKRLISGASCHSRDKLDEKIRTGKDRNLMKTTTNLTPGYYGSRGLRLMSENIMHKFTPKLKERAPIDRLISARGPTAFVESVIVPELTVLLIKEDMKVDEEEAREILKESCEIGDLVNEEIKDVVKLKPKEKRYINDSDDDDDDDFNF
ncbi:hypothetical protein sscle_01g003280 [Sclerotinia sclerotiorum 1980 UF-70]|uniref:Restriction of telomere capping protein 4 n=2 Tax=Sclerotinia sclerotiorum (strain ATCC 18683 / 1980 / Ss-1) TaxID=665079 RepID=A0A1D9PS51_SCLS1|nr:hypothetical protein sscle_01g003280 [Sclerotinia sclerotiorum 1980 UF-70]